VSETDLCFTICFRDFKSNPCALRVGYVGVSGVTSAACSSLRVRIYPLRSPSKRLSTSARPVPRLAPVIKTVLFAMFLPFTLSLPFSRV
jgi:hypothetical protein